MRLAEKHSFPKAAKKASVLLAPAPLKSCSAFSVAKVAVNKPLSMTHQPSEKCRMHRKVNVITLEDLKTQSLDLSVQSGLHVADSALCLFPTNRGGTKGKSTNLTGHRSCNGAEGGLGVTLQHAKSSTGFKHKASQLRLAVRCARLGGNHNGKCHACQNLDNVQNCDLLTTRLVAKKAKVHLQHRLLQGKSAALSLLALRAHAHFTPRLKGQVSQLMLKPLRQSWLARLFTSFGAMRNIVRSFRLNVNKLQVCLLKASCSNKRFADQSCA